MGVLLLCCGMGMHGSKVPTWRRMNAEALANDIYTQAIDDNCACPRNDATVLVVC